VEVDHLTALRTPTVGGDLIKCYIQMMKTTTEKAAAALDLLPEDMRESAVAYLLEQAEKFRVLKEAIAEGMDDVAAGRVTDWNFERFLRDARAASDK
jgi:hypothetical protein